MNCTVDLICRAADDGDERCIEFVKDIQESVVRVNQHYLVLKDG